jgi:hypothetical protein
MTSSTFLAKKPSFIICSASIVKLAFRQVLMKRHIFAKVINIINFRKESPRSPHKKLSFMEISGQQEIIPCCLKIISFLIWLKLEHKIFLLLKREVLE